MKTPTLLFLLFLSTSYLGCDLFTDSPNRDVIMPLANGRAWRYNIVTYPRDSVEPQYQSGLDSIRNTKFIGVEQWYTLSDWSVNDSLFYINRADGLWQKGKRESFGIVTDFYELLVPFPADIGTSLPPDTILALIEYPINSGYYVYTGATGALTLIEKDVTVSVPAGDFSCYHYQIVQRDTLTGRFYHKRNAYYAVNVGLIQEESYWRDSIGNPRLYRINKLKSMNWRK